MSEQDKVNRMMDSITIGLERIWGEPPVRSSELFLRPADATHDALRKCLRWLDVCRELGWAESVMPDLESLFWTYHDSAGNKKPPNDEDKRPEAAT